MKLLSLVLTILLASLTAQSKVLKPSIGKPLGLTFIFKNKAITDMSVRSAFYKKHSLKLSYRSKNNPVDEVTFLDAKMLEKSLTDLKQICSEFEKSSEIESCEVTTEMTPPVGECPPKNQNLKNIASAASGISSNCDLVNAKKLQSVKQDGSLSPLWAQNMIGSDLARARMAEIEATKGPVNEVSVGDFDGGYSKAHITGKTSVDWSEADGGKFQDHGTKVVNLINGKGAYSTGYKVNMTVLADGYTGSFSKAVDQIAQNPPEILNFEFHSVCSINGSCSSNPKAFKQGLDTLVHKSIVVAAAGNYYGETKEQTDPLLFGTILVGSADPNGLVSDFSDEDPNISILAPSDHFLYSPGVNGVDFSGTSGATPLVTGALSNAKAILGKMSIWDAKVLLKRTATPMMVTSGANKKNGVGLLNSYKLVRVAERLKSMGWPEKQIDLKNPELYDFKKEASALSQLAADTLKKGSDCKSLATALTLYRKSFLLDSDDSTAEHIADVLDKTSYAGDSAFYKNRNPVNLVVTLQTGVANQNPLVSAETAQRNLKLINLK